MMENEQSLNKIIVREMVESDFDDLMEVWASAELKHTPDPSEYKARFSQEIHNPDIHYVGAEVDGKIVGVMITTDDGRKGWLSRLAVNPKYQRKGIAEKMMLESERILTSKGIRVFSCLIYEDNHMSIPLVQKLGYTGHENVVYFMKRLDKKPEPGQHKDCN